MKRALLTERPLTDLNRRRSLSDDESLCLEGAIAEQLAPRRDRHGRLRPRRYVGRFSTLAMGQG